MILIATWKNSVNNVYRGEANLGTYQLSISTSIIIELWSNYLLKVVKLKGLRNSFFFSTRATQKEGYKNSQLH